MREEPTEMDKVNAYCIALIKILCVDTNATTARVTQENVTFKGELLGDYKITIERLK